MADIPSQAPLTEPTQTLTPDTPVALDESSRNTQAQSYVQETVVVPPAGPQAGGGENPFIPQGVVTGNAYVPPGAPPKSGGGSFLRRMLLIVVFFLFIAGAVFGGKYLLGSIGGAKGVTITYWGLWENDAIVSPIIADFEAKNNKIKVQYIKQSPKQYRERLQAAIARGDGPDVFRFHNTWVAMLRNDLAMVPATVMTPSQFSSAFYPVANADLVAGENIFGIPLEIDGLGLYYNEDLFATAGVTPPTTWEEMLTVVPKLTVKNETTIITSALALGTTGNIEHFSDIVATMIMQNGSSLREPATKEAEEALVFYRKFATPTDPVYTWNESLDNSVYAFASGKVAMILAPSWRAFDIKQINPDLRFKIAPIPQLPGSTVTWASYWVEGVSAKSKNQEAAWQFMKYLTSRETAMKLYAQESKTRLFGEPYARIDLASSISDDPYVGSYVKQAQNAKSFPLASRTFDNGINDKLIKYLEDAINSMIQNSEAPGAALQTVSSGFRQVLSGYGLTSNAAP